MMADIKRFKLLNNNIAGFVIPTLLMVIVIFSIFMVTVGTIMGVTLGDAGRNQSKQTAFNIAEAGVNYYLWHISHDKTDFKDGNSTPNTPDPILGYGPYVHDYRDGTGNVIGTFTLYIKPGNIGSNVATVQSEGKMAGLNGSSRTIKAQIGAPSFSTYSVVSNSQLWFGDTETADGPVHSNVGVKMDGPNNSDVTSANATYVPTNSGPGSGSSKPGVWCDTGITNPNCVSRSKASWRYPVPAINFNNITADLCQLKKTATNNQASNACNLRPARTAGYLPPRATGFNLRNGYLITLNNNGTYNLSNVNNERDTRSSYSNALTTSVVANNIAIPANGVIFAEDNVWVRSEASGFDGRVTIASARIAVSGSTTLTVADNLVYDDQYSGNDVIGLIAEDNVDIAPYVPVPLRVHAAMIAQTGRVQFRPQYRENGSSTIGYVNSSQRLDFFGSVASEEQWTWSWIRCGSQNSPSCWSGFKHNATKYDENLRYSPPPFFPVTNTYDILEWREVISAA